MRFEIRSAWGNGEMLLDQYGCLKKYNAVVENYDLFITLNSLQDLMDLVRAVGNDIVITEDELIIYDDYIE